jgi:MYXO-CTERM domain-containing protein
VLVDLQQANGLIAADSSIWEVHWDGQQKHFAYTTITAANGLCSASRLAQAAGDTAEVPTYLAAGQKSRDALLPNLRATDGSLVQSTEALAAGTGYLDAAVMEAIGMGLIDPTRHTAAATLTAIENGLVPASGRGFKRSDAGDAYSSNEWVFVDLRAARALELEGNTTYSQSLFAWNVDQASDNFGELSELHDPVTADYAGQSPMVGFGAGAYLVSLFDRGKPVVPTCGTFASEPGNASDAGTDAAPAPGDGGGPGPDGGVEVHDGGAGSGSGSDSGAAPNQEAPRGSSGGCGCVLGDAGSTGSALVTLAPLALLALRRRRT